MVTRDVDEALYLSDRVVCMTDGPEATIGEILAVPFARPRDRKTVMEHANYPRLRNELITFLEHRAHRRPPGAEPTAQIAVGAAMPSTVVPASSIPTT